MPTHLSIGIIGPTGLVGEALLASLNERNFPYTHLFLIRNANTTPKTENIIPGKTVQTISLSEVDFSKIDLCFFCSTANVAKAYAEKAISKGCFVIDNSSAFRCINNTPLIIPEINGNLLDPLKKPSIIANPNCTTIILLMVLHALKYAGIQTANLASYQAASGGGKNFLESLKQDVDTFSTIKEIRKGSLLFSAISGIGPIAESGDSEEEEKIVAESKYILNDSTIHIHPTTVRVPVLNCHSIALHIETKYVTSTKEITDHLKLAKGIKYCDDKTPTPHSVNGEDDVHVGRIRKLSGENWFALWIVGDNLKKGAALNAVQIAERLLKVKTNNPTQFSEKKEVCL